MDPRKAKELLDAGRARLIDVRSQPEAHLERIPGAELVPLAGLAGWAAERKPEPLVLYCASGRRSQRGVARLRDELGWSRVEHVDGGLEAWRAAGLPVEGDSRLDEAQRRRYARQLVLEGFGEQGQRRLIEGSALILGAGGLGSPAALYLAAAGVGRIGIADDDAVEVSNLQRQVLHSQLRVGIPKARSAAKTLLDLNPQIRVETHERRLDAGNVIELIRGYDVVVDGTDNFATRYLVGDAAARLQIPVVSASILAFQGQVSVFSPPEGPCYRCLYPEPPPAELAPGCGTAGVLGSMAGTIGALQATEAVKLLAGIGRPLIGRLLIYDALEAAWSELRAHRDPACPVCASPAAPEDPFPDYVTFCDR